MATVITPVRSDRAYFGFAKETVPGTPVAPAYFPRWLDGSMIQIDAKMEDVWEGDGSRRLSSIVKNQQTVKIKLICLCRPNELGFFEAMAQGASSDVYTAPSVSTTLSALVAVNATSISVAANTGLTGSTAIPLALSAGTVREEIPTFQPPVTGAGPYVLPVAASYNGGKIALAHNNADTVQSAASHVITDQADGNYYTVEVSIGDTAGIILRIRDCKVDQIKRSGKAGGLLTYEIDLQGIACAVQASPATIVLDTHSYFFYTSGVWTIDGSTTGDAIGVESFDIAQKNNLDNTIQTEQLTLAALIFGNIQVDVGINLIWQNANKTAQVYFGSAAGTTDAQAIYVGSLLLVFSLADGLNSVQFSTPALDYTKADLPQPKKDGKGYRQALSASSVSNFGANAYVLQTTVANTTYSAY